MLELACTACSQARSRDSRACSGASAPKASAAARHSADARAGAPGIPETFSALALTISSRPRTAPPSRVSPRPSRRASARCWAPAVNAASAAATTRVARVASSGLSSAALARKVARAAYPPRRPARSAERSSSAATSSSGPAAAAERCQARRSACAGRDVTAASAACARRRCTLVAPPYTADRSSGCANTTVAPTVTSRAASARPAASPSIPESAAAAVT